MGKRTSFYLTETLEKKLRITEEIGLSGRVSRIIDRFMVIVDCEKNRLIELFSEGEWNAMRNQSSSAIWEPASVIRNGVLNQIRDCLDTEINSYEANRKDIEDKLKVLTVAQQIVLVEMIEEWRDKQ